MKSALINHTLGIIQKTKLPYYHFDETRQIGHSFCDRLTNAFEYIFNQGFEKVIAVGNDCPNLTSKHLLTASRKLSGDTMVLAKDNHGGAALIGMCRSGFSKSSFESIRWQTDFVFADLQRLHPTALLSGSFVDINQKADAVAAIRLLHKGSLLYHLFYDIIELRFFYAASQTRHLLRKSFSLFSLRAPPLLF